MEIKKILKKSVAFVATAAMVLSMVIVPVDNKNSYAATTQGDN